MTGPLAEGHYELVRVTYFKFIFPRAQGERSVLNYNLYLASCFSYHSFLPNPPLLSYPTHCYMQSSAIPPFLCRKFYLHSLLCSVKLSNVKHLLCGSSNRPNHSWQKFRYEYFISLFVTKIKTFIFCPFIFI